MPEASKAPEPMAPAPPAPAADDVIWEGDSGPYHVRWGRGDLVARRRAAPSTEVFSAKAEIQTTFNAQIASYRGVDSHEKPAAGSAAAPVPDACEGDSTVRLLSLVGSLLSYQEVWSMTCPMMAHPAEEIFYRTYDLDAKRYISLDDVFPEEELFAALSADKIVKDALAKSSAKPKTLQETISALRKGAGSVTDELCFSVPEDLLSRFAFHHMTADRVAVRIGLPGAGPCRLNLTELGLLLSVPAKLRQAIDKAKTAEEGALSSMLESRHARGDMVVSFKAVP